MASNRPQSFIEYKRERAKLRRLAYGRKLLVLVIVIVILWALSLTQLPQLILGGVAQIFVVPKTTLPQSVPTGVNTQIVPNVVIAQVTDTTSPIVVPQPTTIQSGELQGSRLNVRLMQQLMFRLVNEDRVANGLGSVAWDELASEVAQGHVQEMADLSYFSHWDIRGWTADIRYVMAGGRDAVMENISGAWSRSSSGQVFPITDFESFVRNAEMGLMNSPGHRANILDPDHTHVGIGVSYNEKTGDFRVAQLFLDRYVTVEPVTKTAQVGDEVVLHGQVLNGTEPPLLTLDFQPKPPSYTAEELNRLKTGSYSNGGQQVISALARMDGSNFSWSVKIGSQGPGYYYVRVWVKMRGEYWMVSSQIVQV